ncbi:hypothetical protein HZA87_04700 [Candidatus Uhrbacteria bacterium]|nr:hypothetical protein [Candidatus Uhrbacteria bacterium]
MDSTAHTQPVRTFVQQLIEGAFPTELFGPRHTGPEEEFIVVDAQGYAVDISPLFHDLMKDGWKPKQDAVTGATVGVHRNDLEVGMDVGYGTLEIGFPHVGNLFNHVGVRADILGFLDGRLADHGFFRLQDYAIQPRTFPSEKLWAPKGRGEIFRRLFPPTVHMNTLTASSQVHIDVTRDEVVPVLEMFLALSAVFIALNANSPVWAGQPDPEGMLATRQDAWYRFTVDHGYWDNVLCGPPSSNGAARTEQAPSSFAELAEFLINAPFIVRVHGRSVESPGASFMNWSARENGNLSEPKKRNAYLNHEGTVWWQARARVTFGTIEVRPSCQNKDAVASDALALGLVENLENALAFVRSSKTHQDWRALQRTALMQGLRSPTLAKAAHHVLTLADEGLRYRGLGEEVLLAPLKQRVLDSTSPAHRKLAVFEKGGINALVEHLIAGR